MLRQGSKRLQSLLFRGEGSMRMSTASQLQAVSKESDILRDPQSDTVGTDAFEYSRHLTPGFMAANWARPSADCTLPTDSMGYWVPFFFVRTFTPDRAYFGEGWTKPVWPPAPREAPFGLSEDLWLEGKKIIAEGQEIRFKSAAQLRSELTKGPEKLPLIPTTSSDVDKSSFKAPTMDDLLKAADRLLDKDGKAEVLALRSQYEDAVRRSFPLRTTPEEPNWDVLAKDLPPAFQDYLKWAKGEWARISKEAGAAAYPADKVNAALSDLKNAQESLFEVQSEALKSLETFLPWQEGTEMIMDKFFKEGNLYVEEYLAVNPAFRERIDQEIMEGNLLGGKEGLDCLPISEGYEQDYKNTHAEMEHMYDAVNNTPGNTISPYGKDWQFDWSRSLPQAYAGPYSPIVNTHH